MICSQGHYYIQVYCMVHYHVYYVDQTVDRNSDVADRFDRAFYRKRLQMPHSMCPCKLPWPQMLNTSSRTYATLFLLWHNKSILF
jgi:hypothetical protein